MELYRDVQIKATPLRVTRAYMDEHLPVSARERVLSALEGEFPEETKKLRDGRIMPSERVPVMMINRMIEHIATQLGEPNAKVAHRIGRRAAEEASTGFLRLALTLISIPNLLRKLAPVWSQLYTHGTIRSWSDGRTATVELTDYPPVSATGCSRITGWFEWFSQKAESSASVDHSDCRARGASLCRWKIAW